MEQARKIFRGLLYPPVFLLIPLVIIAVSILAMRCFSFAWEFTTAPCGSMPLPATTFSWR